MTRRMANVTTKSTIGARTAATGIASRGKYTLVTKAALLTKLEPLRLMACEKNVHGNNAANEKIGYGNPSDGIPDRRLNSSVKISIVASGCRTAHTTPIAVCL